MASPSTSPRLSRFIEGETFTCPPPSSALFNDIIVEMDQHQSRSSKRYASSSFSSSNSSPTDAKKHKRSASNLFSTLTSPKKESFRKSVITLSPGAYETLAPASNELSVAKDRNSSSEDEADASVSSKKKAGIMKGRFRTVNSGKAQDKRASVESLG